jgi:CBS domain-containing protein
MNFSPATIAPDLARSRPALHEKSGNGVPTWQFPLFLKALSKQSTERQVQYAFQEVPMEVRQIMSSDVERIAPDTTLQEAAMRMKMRDVGFLPVCEGDRVLGTLTDRDIIIRGVTRGVDVRQTSASDVMSKDVFYCYVDEDVEAVAQAMSDKQVRRMIIMDRDERIVGIVSLGDIAKAGTDEEVSAETLRSVSSEEAA